MVLWRDSLVFSEWWVAIELDGEHWGVIFDRWGVITEILSSGCCRWRSVWSCRFWSCWVVVAVVHMFFLLVIMIWIGVIGGGSVSRRVSMVFPSTVLESICDTVSVYDVAACCKERKVALMDIGGE